MPREYKSKKAPDYVAAAATETGNKPPFAPEVEEAVIGAMLVDENSIICALECLSEKSFFNPKLRLVFRAISDLFNSRTAVDITTVAEKLRESGVLEEVGGLPELVSLTSDVGSAANVEYYIKILQQKTIQRDLIEVGYGILKKAFDETYNVDALIGESQTELYNAILGSSKGGYEDLGAALNKAIARIERSQKSTGLTGVPSGFPSLDAITMGWQDGNLIVIGARPGHGKTAIALNMARAAAVDHGIPTAFFTLEMTDVELADRLIGMETGMSSLLRKGRKKMTYDDWMYLEEAIAKAAKAPLYIDETPALTISDFKTRIKRLQMDRHIEIAFVDYLQLMNGSGAANQYRAQEIGEISRQLKETAKELHIPIIALAQLNRNLIARSGSMNGRPVLSDLKDSGSIEQDADIVLFINRPGLMGFSEHPEEAELIIAKNRAGEMAILPMTFNGDLTKFSEASSFPEPIPAPTKPASSQKSTASTRSSSPLPPPPPDAFDPFAWKDSHN